MTFHKSDKKLEPPLPGPLLHKCVEETEKEREAEQSRGIWTDIAGRWQGLALAAGAAALVLAVSSCGTVTRSVVMLPNVPGAKYIGSKECEQCHEDLYRGFINTADH